MKFLMRFHRDDSAQISFLAVAGAICFIGLLSMIINTDDIITDRVHMQDVADTTALSSAAWTARGLNMVSFINVLNSKLISTAVLLNALTDTIPAVQAVGEIQRAIFQGCTGVPFVGPFCAAMAAIIQAQLTVLKPLGNKLRTASQKLSRCPGGQLWTIMNTLQGVSQVVKETFTFIGIAESVAMAKANGAEFGIVVNGQMADLKSGRNAFSLPVTDEDFNAFCPYVKNGGSGYKMAGYQCGQGPLELGQARINKFILFPFVNLFAQPIFKGMSSSHYRQIGCTPDPGEKDEGFKVTLRDLAECREFDATAKWAHVYSYTDPIDEDGLGIDDFTPWQKLTPDSASETEDEELPNVSQEDLDRIRVDRDPEDAIAEQTFTPGPKWNLLKNETTGQSNVPVNCDGPVYPLYSPPISSFDSARPGRIGNGFFPTGFNPKRITEWSEFKWFSATHRSPGPEDVGGYFIRVGKETIEGNEEEKIPDRFRYIVETVSLISAGTTTMDQSKFEEYMNRKRPDGTAAVSTQAGNGSTGCRGPRPFMLDKGDDEEKFRNKLKFMSVVWKTIDSPSTEPFWSNYFDTPPEVAMGYAQAEVYNHLSEDTFTQDWRVRLQRADLLEELLKSGKVPGSGALGRFSEIISRVNNH